MKTNKGLVEYAKKALSEKWGYVWGTFGYVLTETLLNQKLAQYPNNICAYEEFIRKNWLGKRTADCAGLIKGYLWYDEIQNKIIYNSKTDTSANGMYNGAKEKGIIGTIPEIQGICVWKKGHIGIYIGGGQVIEAKGTKYGVVQTPLEGAGANTWTHWLKCPFVEYVKEVRNMKLGSRGEDVKELQTLLKINADGIFGRQTLSAVLETQRNNGLVPDGIVGEKTWAVLMNKKENKEEVKPPVNYSILKYGSRSEEVKKLQQMLYITADGIFGKGTRETVLAFQKDNGLVVDGIVGAKTWGAFDNDYVIVRPNKYTTIAKVKKSSIKKADVILAKQPVEHMESIYKRYKPTILINAGLFDMKTGATVSGLVDEGKSIAKCDITWYGMFIKGDNEIGFGDYRYVGKVRDFLGASPSLVKGGKVVIDNPLRSIMSGYNPRSAIGMNDEYFFIVAIDGRRSFLPGMTGNQLANFTFNIGCKEAMNLDGGHSTRLLVNGKVINNPSGLRAVDTALAIYI